MACRSEEADRSRGRRGRHSCEPSRNRGHSRSPSHSYDAPPRNRKPDDYGVDATKITDDDTAFILAKGKTKEKIFWVSEVEIEFFERDLELTQQEGQPGSLQTIELLGGADC